MNKDEILLKAQNENKGKDFAEKEVQRDLYSAFLLYCADNDFKIIDRNKCLKEFDKFWEKHQIFIQEIIQNGKHICNSGIKAA